MAPIMGQSEQLLRPAPWVTIKIPKSWTEKMILDCRRKKVEYLNLKIKTLTSLLSFCGLYVIRFWVSMIVQTLTLFTENFIIIETIVSISLKTLDLEFHTIIRNVMFALIRLQRGFLCFFLGSAGFYVDDLIYLY